MSQSAAALRKHLLMPPNGRHSDETEIVSPQVWLRREAKKVDAAPEAAPDPDIDWAPKALRRACSVKEIVDVVADFYGISLFDIASERRDSYLVTARHVAMYLARHHTGKTNSQLGREFGDRDHTTVINGVRRITLRIAEEKRMRAELCELRARLGLVVTPRVSDAGAGEGTG